MSMSCSALASDIESTNERQSMKQEDGQQKDSMTGAELEKQLRERLTAKLKCERSDSLLTGNSEDLNQHNVDQGSHVTGESMANDNDKNEKTSELTLALREVPDDVETDLQLQMTTSNDVNHTEVSEEANKSECPKDEDAKRNKETREKSNEGKHPKKEKRKKEKKHGKHKKKKHKSDNESKTRDHDKDGKSSHRREHKRSKKDDKHKDKNDKKKDSDGEKQHHSRKKSKNKKDCESEKKSDIQISTEMKEPESKSVDLVAQKQVTAIDQSGKQNTVEYTSIQKTHSELKDVKPEDEEKERKDQKRKADTDGHVDEIKRLKLDESSEVSGRDANSGNDDQKSSDTTDQVTVKKEPECYRRVICKIRDPGKKQEKAENLHDKSIEMKKVESKSEDSAAQKQVSSIDQSGKQSTVEDGALEVLKVGEVTVKPTESPSDDKRGSKDEKAAEVVVISSTSKSETLAKDVKTSFDLEISTIEKDSASHRVKEESSQRKQTKTSSKEVSESSRKGKEEEKESKRKVDDSKKDHSSHTDRDRTENSTRRERDRNHDKERDRSVTDRRGGSGRGESKYRSRESHKSDSRHRNDSRSKDQSKKDDLKESGDSRRRQEKKSTDRSDRSSDRRNDSRRQHSDRRDERGHSDRRTQNKESHGRDRSQDEKSRDKEKKESRDRLSDDKNKTTAKKDDKTSGKQQTADPDGKHRKEQRSKEQVNEEKSGTVEKGTSGKVLNEDTEKVKMESITCSIEEKDDKTKSNEGVEKGKPASCEKAKEPVLESNSMKEEKPVMKVEERENAVNSSFPTEKLDEKKEEKSIVSSVVEEKEIITKTSETARIRGHSQGDTTDTPAQEKEQEVAETQQSLDKTDEAASEKTPDTLEKKPNGTEKVCGEEREKSELKEKKSEKESDKDKKPVSTRHRASDEKEKRRDTRDKGRDEKEDDKSEKRKDEDRNKRRDEREKPREGRTRRREDTDSRRDGRDKSKDEEKRKSSQGRDRDESRRQEKEKHDDKRRDSSQRRKEEDKKKNESSKHESRSKARDTAEKSKESSAKEKVEKKSAEESIKMIEEKEKKDEEKEEIACQGREVAAEKESGGEETKEEKVSRSEEKGIVKEENETSNLESFRSGRSGIEANCAEQERKPVEASAAHLASLTEIPCHQRNDSIELEGRHESRWDGGEHTYWSGDISYQDPVADDSRATADDAMKKEMELEPPEDSVANRQGYTDTITQSIIDDLEAYVLESTNMSGSADDPGHAAGQDGETGRTGRGLKSRFNISITASSLQRITGHQGTSSNSLTIISKGTTATAPQAGIGTFSKPSGVSEAKKEAPLRGRLVDPPWIEDNETEENVEGDVKSEVAANPLPEASDLKPDPKPEPEEDQAVLTVAPVIPVKVEEPPRKKKRSRDRRSRSSSRGHRRSRNKRRRSRSRSRGRHRSRRKRRRRGRRSSRSSSSRSSTRSSSSSSHRRRRTSDRRRRSHSRSGRRTSKRRRRDRSRSSHRSRKNASPADKRRAAEVRLGIDRKKLRRIAILNMLRTTRPGLTNVASLSNDELQRFQAGGVEMDELQEICKELTAKQEKLRAKGAAEHIIEAAMLTDEEEVEECRAKAKLESADRAGRDRSDKSKTRDRLAFNISEAVKVVPLVSPAEPVIKREQLLEMFPVSSGIRHQTSDETKPASDVAQSSSANPEGTTETPAITVQKPSAGTNLGEFTGKVELVPLSQKELQAGIQPWLKKNQFVSAAPVTNSIGQELLKRMGWREGEGLGKNKDGLRQPVLVDIKVDRKGLSSVGETVSKKPQPLVPASQAQGTSASVLSTTGSASAVTSPGVAAGRADKHPVSILLEHSNRRRWNSPQYQVVSESGPSHSRNFLMSVTVNGQVFMPSAPSRSKKEAKLAAANAAVDGLALE